MAIIQISTAAQLALIGNDVGYPLTGEYIQTTDIDMDESGVSYNVGSVTGNFYPIGRTEPGSYTNFRGTYDGQGFKIKNIKIVLEEDGISALFTGLGTGAIVERIDLSGRIRGESVVGSLVMEMQNDSILRNCISRVDVRNEDAGEADGLVGYADTNTKIQNCLFVGTLSSVEFENMGIKGGGDGTVTNSYFDSQVALIAGQESIGDPTLAFYHLQG